MPPLATEQTKAENAERAVRSADARFIHVYDDAGTLIETDDTRASSSSGEP
jgi:hypothetical protein